jgi:beta-glucosidase
MRIALPLFFLFCLVRQSSSTPGDSIESRIDTLIGRMTLQEKADLLGGTGFASKTIDRLGIPSLKMTDGPVGVRWGGKSTAFPCGAAMAASFDTALVAETGRALGYETKAKGRNVLLGPCINIDRVPFSGRNFESFGEDPYLTSRIAVAYIMGVQSQNVIATVKHFACNNQEFERTSVNTIVDERALNEIYLPGFKAAVQEGGCRAVMSAYNKVNGDYCSQNEQLLTGILKNKWKFSGLLMSDWGAVHSTVPTLNAGLDIEMPVGRFLRRALVMSAVENGDVTETAINDKIRRLLRAMLALRLFDKTDPVPALDSTTHRDLCLKIARNSIVLLKNTDRVLPLDIKKMKSVAIIGPYSDQAQTGGGGSSQIEPFYAVSLLQGMQRKAGPALQIRHARGLLSPDQTEVIKSEYLLPQKGSSKHGLSAEYFDNVSLKEKSKAQRVDSLIDFHWGEAAPAPELKPDSFSVRWTGFIVPPKTGEYLLSVRSDDGTRLYLHDSLVIDNWGMHGVIGKTASANLIAGEPMPVRLEFYDAWHSAEVTLSWQMPGTMEEAIIAAKQSDAAIVCVGLTHRLEAEGFDLERLTLPFGQDRLIREVVKANKRTIVVLYNGTPLLLKPWIDEVPAVLETWYPGQEGGTAIADILFGDVNPSGKLPATFPKRWEDAAAYGNYPGKDSAVKYAEGIYVGYRHFDAKGIEPLFPFGYGLSYTSFAYAGLKILKSKEKDSTWTAKCTVKNTGSRAGAEIVQLYISDINASVDRPPKDLKGFQKVFLKPGEQRELTFRIGSSALAFYDTASHGWKVEPGTFKVMIGASSRDIRQEATFDF